MSLPEYSDGALSARDLFFGSFVSVHFFVEDEQLENLYEVVLKKIFPRLSNFEVFPLAGKQNVLRHARAGHTKPQHLMRVYVLDRDFDDLLGALEIRDGVFYLDHYCIENVVYDESSLLKVCVEERPRVRRTDLKRRLDFKSALDSWLPLLDRLHRAFALVQVHNLGIPNTDAPPEEFTVDGDASILCQTKISRYIDRVREALALSGVVSSEKEFDELSRKIFGSKRIDCKRINGKFLARLYYHRLRRKDLVGNIRQDTFLMRCGNASSCVGLRPFAKRVRAYMRAAGVSV